MTIDLSTWLGDAGDLAAIPTATTAQRAVLAWRRIQDRPSSVAFRTPAGVTLSAQTVRVEVSRNARTVDSAAGVGPVLRVVVFGVRSHPTQADTTIGEGYRFIQNGAEFRVVAVLTPPGEVQALAEASG